MLGVAFKFRLLDPQAHLLDEYKVLPTGEFAKQLGFSLGLRCRYHLMRPVHNFGSNLTDLKADL